MAHNKVMLGNEPLIDLSNDSVDKTNLAFGVTAHDKNGERITGECINADTVSGWHFAVKEGSTPDSTTKPTITLMYTVG